MRPRAAKWEELDWRLANKILADQTGTHPKTVNKWRKRLNKERSEAPTRKLKGFIDWSKTNHFLAKKHGVSKGYISNLRKRNGAPPSPDSNKFGPMHTRNWKAVDWSKKNTAIAKELRCGRTTVRRMRKKFAK